MDYSATTLCIALNFSDIQSSKLQKVHMLAILVLLSQGGL